MKKAIMNTMIILFALAMCVGCGQSSEQKEESVPTDVTKAEKQEQVQVEAEDEDTLENGEQVFRVVEVMPKFPGGDYSQECKVSTREPRQRRARACDLFVCGNEGWNAYELQGP